MNVQAGKSPQFVSFAAQVGYVGVKPPTSAQLADVLQAGSWSVSAGSGPGGQIGGNGQWLPLPGPGAATTPVFLPTTGVNNVTVGTMTPQVGIQAGYNLGPFQLFKTNNKGC
jgi:hypothetical protein